jgi:large subunit ribosomal protein L9
MKVVLTQDVPHVGQKGDSPNVANGYGINYLIPRGLALKADTPQGMSYLKRVSDSKVKKELASEAMSEKLANLVGKEFILQVESNDAGVLFAGITASKLAAELSAQTGLTVKSANLGLPADSIKEVGEYQIELQDQSDKLGKINVTIQ